ncbi:hypothetical protein KIPB_010891, partial [Kipferlia bialata]|eukprot:g10891.t1
MDDDLWRSRDEQDELDEFLAIEQQIRNADSMVGSEEDPSQISWPLIDGASPMMGQGYGNVDSLATPNSTDLDTSAHPSSGLGKGVTQRDMEREREREERATPQPINLDDFDREGEGEYVNEQPRESRAAPAAVAAPTQAGSAEEYQEEGDAGEDPVSRQLRVLDHEIKRLQQQNMDLETA